MYTYKRRAMVHTVHRAESAQVMAERGALPRVVKWEQEQQGSRTPATTPWSIPAGYSTSYREFGTQCGGTRTQTDARRRYERAAMKHDRATSHLARQLIHKNLGELPRARFLLASSETGRSWSNFRCCFFTGDAEVTVDPGRDNGGGNKFRGGNLYECYDTRLKIARVARLAVSWVMAVATKFACTVG